MKVLTGTLVVALICVVVLVAVYPSESDNRLPHHRDFTNREVVVYSDDAFTEKASNILKDLTGQTINYISKTSDNLDMVLLDGFWLTSGGEGVPSSSEIMNMLNASIPLMFVNDSSFFYEDSDLSFQAVMTLDASMAYCLFRDLGGKTSIYSYGGDNFSDALISAYEWADKISSPVLASEEAVAGDH